MKLHTSLKPELIASKQKHREAITEPWLEIDEKGSRIIATNGFSLVVIPCETTPEDHPGRVSGDVLKVARKKAGRDKIASVALNGVAKFNEEETAKRSNVDPGLVIPPWRAVVPNNDPEKVLRVGINAKQLADLAEAMGTDCVALEIVDGKTCIIVRPSASPAAPPSPDAMALIMPCRIH